MEEIGQVIQELGRAMRHGAILLHQARSRVVPVQLAAATGGDPWRPAGARSAGSGPQAR